MGDGAPHNPFSGMAAVLLLAAGSETSCPVAIDDVH
jgi:hypothetical protein